MGGMSKINTLLDPVGSILGFSPTEKLFGGGKSESVAVPTPAPASGGKVMPASEVAKRPASRTSAMRAVAGRDSTILVGDDKLGG